MFIFGGNDRNRMEQQAQAAAAALEMTQAESYRLLAEAAMLTGRSYVLEVGCHEGNLTQALINRWGELVEPFGLDRNLPAIAGFNRRFGGTRGKAHDLEEGKPLDYAEGTFDLIVFSFVAEYLSITAFLRLILEMKRLAPRVLFCVHSVPALLPLGIFPLVEPGRYLIPGCSEAPMRVGTEMFYRQGFLAGGYKEFTKVGSACYPDNPLLSILSGTEATAVYSARR